MTVLKTLFQACNIREMIAIDFVRLSCKVMINRPVKYLYWFCLDIWLWGERTAVFTSMIPGGNNTNDSYVLISVE